jgi:hypothetical protein
MTDKQQNIVSNTTRRGFLALAGTTTLAGCNGFGDIGRVFEEEPPSLDGRALKDALSTTAPTVPETVPIPIQESKLDETAAGVQKILESVPTPFDAQDIPNGAIREQLNDRHDGVTTRLEEAAQAPSPIERMARLRDAREYARVVAAAWAAINGELSFTDVRKEVSRIRDAFDAFRGRWDYVGGEPVRAVRAHAHIEGLVANAGRRISGAVERYTREPVNVIQVGGFAGTLEGARVALDDAAYLYEQYKSSLATPRRIRSPIITASESLGQLLENQREDLPEGNPREPSSFVDQDIKDTPVGFAMTELYQGISYASGLEDKLATGQRTRAILAVTETLVRVRAFGLLRERVTSGNHVTVETASDVQQMRDSAIEAFEQALKSTRNPQLTRYILAEIDYLFEYADTELDDYSEDEQIGVEYLSRELSRYVSAGAMAQATPSTSADVAEEIRRVF